MEMKLHETVCSVYITIDGNRLMHIKPHRIEVRDKIIINGRVKHINLEGFFHYGASYIYDKVKGNEFELYTLRIRPYIGRDNWYIVEWKNGVEQQILCVIIINAYGNVIVKFYKQPGFLRPFTTIDNSPFIERI